MWRPPRQQRCWKGNGEGGRGVFFPRCCCCQSLSSNLWPFWKGASSLP